MAAHSASTRRRAASRSHADGRKAAMSTKSRSSSAPPSPRAASPAPPQQNRRPAKRSADSLKPTRSLHSAVAAAKSTASVRLPNPKSRNAVAIASAVNGQEDEEDDDDDDESYDFETLRDDEDDDEDDDDIDGDDDDIEDDEDDDEDTEEFTDDDDDQQSNGESSKAKSNGSSVSSARTFRSLRREDRPEIEPVYDSDTSDEETENTVGNIPMEWYDDFPHIGYDINGNKIARPAKGDALDAFLKSMDDKDAWRKVHDKLEGKDITLSPDELDMLRRIHQHEFPDSAFDPYEPTVEWFTSKTEVMPISAAPEPKRRFIPSKHEASRIMKVARAIRAGLIVPGNKNKKTSSATGNASHAYDIWAGMPEETDRPGHIPPPRTRLPEHIESYNPPAEYLLTPEEQAKWDAMDPSDRPHAFIPQKHKSLRAVPAYNRFIQERFERCLDLYLAPRAMRNKLEIDPESLIPKLPKPQDLEPFPTKLSIVYAGHTGRVRSLSTDPTGHWLATGGDDKTVRIWETNTGRCIETLVFTTTVMAVAWNPNKGVSLLAVAADDGVVIVVPTRVSYQLQDSTREVIDDIWTQHGDAKKAPQSGDADGKDEEDGDEDVGVSHGSKNSFTTTWRRSNDADRKRGILARIPLDRPCTNLVWHRKGDYFSTLSPDTQSKAVQIHQLSSGRSQSPFRRTKGHVQCVIFHPTRPIFFVATQRFIRVYDLVKQHLVKKLVTGSRWISSIDIHPGGDNLIVGTYDKRVHWFDLDLSTTPYKTLRFHRAAVRSVAYHQRHPLFASSSDDGSLILFHGMVYNDLMQNPLIVPLKTIGSAHAVTDHLGALGVVFHPTQPWVFSCGADGLVKMFS